MNRVSICKSLQEAGYDAVLSGDRARLTVTLHVAGRTLALVHVFPDELLQLPRFDIAGSHGFGRLAHVLSVGDRGGGEVCIGDAESTSVSRDRPELVYLQTIEEHYRLLKELIEDPVYNRDELLREFDAHWGLLCGDAKGTRDLFVAWDGTETAQLQVKPAREGERENPRSKPIVLAAGPALDGRLAGVRQWMDWDRRPTKGRGIGLRLDCVEPAPATVESVPAWYFEAVAGVDAAGRKALKRMYRKGSIEYWVVFSAEIPGGDTLFAVRWRAQTKGFLPASETEAQAGGWKAAPYRVRSLSRGSLVPRGGGSLDLGAKSVLLVGCGSVGSEVAYALTSAGMGQLTISDPDKMSEENLYRHALSLSHCGMPKCAAIADELALKHPWAAVEHWAERLEKLRSVETLRRFDLVVIAIGSPTVERAFAEYTVEAEVGVPTLNCWLEGFGIGGHAILTLPGSLGCWHCAYVDPKTLEPGLSSNLNFLAADQIVMRNHGGCGTQFLPFSGIAAKQTAAMAADLAVAFLSGEVRESSRVSWHGRDTEAGRANLETTYRYRHFKESLQVLPLRDENCGHCHG
jgi:molybdopterin/thiamine biosynthesis adenylyltransferase